MDISTSAVQDNAELGFPLDNLAYSKGFEYIFCCIPQKAFDEMKAKSPGKLEAISANKDYNGLKEIFADYESVSGCISGGHGLGAAIADGANEKNTGIRFHEKTYSNGKSYIFAEHPEGNTEADMEQMFDAAFPGSRPEWIG